MVNVRLRRGTFPVEFLAHVFTMHADGCEPCQNDVEIRAPRVKSRLLKDRKRCHQVILYSVQQYPWRQQLGVPPTPVQSRASQTAIPIQGPTLLSRINLISVLFCVYKIQR